MVKYALIFHKNTSFRALPSSVGMTDTFTMSADLKGPLIGLTGFVIARFAIISIILAISSDWFLPAHSRPAEPNPKSHLPGAVSANENAKGSVVPVQILAGYTILIPTTINRSHIHLFILDTGASHTTISKALAHEAGLAVIGKSKIWGAGETSYSVDVTHATLQAGSVTVTNDYLLDDLSAAEETFGTRLGGILGLDFFQNSVLEIDYARARVVTHASETYRYSGSGQIFNRAIRDQQPFLTGQVRIAGHDVSGIFELDSGANQFTALLNAPFADEHHLKLPDSKVIYVPGLPAVGGEISLFVERGEGLRFGHFTISRPIMGLLPSRSVFGSRTDVAGAVGGDFMRRFTVILDSPNHRIILEPNSDVNQPSRFDNSGTVLRAIGSGLARLEVYKVVAGSPAAKAGLRAGDIIDAIDHQPFAHMTVDKVRTMFQQDSGDYELAITRDKSKQIIHLRLRPLL